MIVAGCPERENPGESAVRIARLALDMIDAVQVSAESIMSRVHVTERSVQSQCSAGQAPACLGGVLHRIVLLRLHECRALGLGVRF
jgi:hypothetical protein